ncbi:hypothetical protein PINS_up001183 [Pythium insidiosum]|nr:hypothetical protein PINS_up001183 [Pythium insidiosum]
MAKTTAHDHIAEVINVIMLLESSTIRFPTDAAQLRKMAADFEKIAGFRGVIGAVGGTLIKQLCPADPVGWFCHKGYAAINMQASVDAKKRFTS